jgi:hypothetical protein
MTPGTVLSATPLNTPAACIGAAVAGFILRAHRRIGVGLAIALIPPLGAL